VLELLLVDPRSGARRRVALSTPVATLGSDLGCEVVLSAPEVARHHARIESTPFGWQLVRQGSGTPVRLNDTSVEKAPLQSGDVLRIGPFQLTVLSVAAPAPAVAAAPAPRPVEREEPIAPPAPRARPSAVRAARLAAPKSAVSPALVYVALGFVAVIAIVAFFLNHGPPPANPELEKRCHDLIAEARVAGAECRFADANESASSAERLATAEMQPTLERLRADLTAQRRRFEEGKRACDELEKLVATDFTGRTQTDVENFLANYKDVAPLRARAEKLRSDLVRRSAGGKTTIDATGVSLPNDRTFQWCCDESKRWLDQGDFAKAKFVLTSVAPTGADQAKQAEQLRAIEAGSRTAADAILARVKDLCAHDRVLEALGELDDDRLVTLRTTDAWWDCVEEADRVEDLVDQKIPIHARLSQRRRHAPPRPHSATADPAKAAAPATPPAVAPPADPPKDGQPPTDGGGAKPKDDAPKDGGGAASASAAPLAQAQALLAQGDFAGAAQQYEQVLASTDDEKLRARLATEQERAVRPLRLGARVAELLAQRPPAAPLPVSLRDGRSVKVRGSDGSRLLLAGDGGDAEGVAPVELSARSLFEISGHVPLEPEHALGRAFVALAAGDEKGFFLCIEKIAADDSLKDGRDRALALQRGLDEVPPRGFLRAGESWVTWAEKAEDDLRKEVRDAVAAFAASSATPGAASAGEKARARVNELAATSPALVLGELKARRAELSKEFFAAPEHEKLKKLRERLLELQRTRKDALTLIFDEVKYPYPHTPANETEYRATQLEVDRLVAIVRASWGREEEEAPQPWVALSPSFAAVVRELRANRQMLYDVGASSDEPDLALMTAWCLPSGGTVHVRNFALDYRERLRLDEDDNVRAFNATIAAGDKGPESGPSRDELALVAITNDYRAMMGRRVLAWNEKLWRSSRGHSDWMSRVGRLTHDEDDPKRANPMLRMALEGYRGGAGENCSVGAGGSAGALHGWYESSGHHRNMLYESHTEMGGAQVGAYWTENFGGAREYRGNLVH
jgi:hypothetical protein